MSAPRFQFLEQAATVLRAMPAAPTVEVGTVRRYGDAPTYPWIGLIPADGSKIEPAAFQGLDVDRFRAYLYGFVQTDGITTVSERLLTLVHDCQRALRQTGSFALLRPGTAFQYATDLIFEEEDLDYTADGNGAEFLLPLVVDIPDDLTT